MIKYITRKIIVTAGISFLSGYTAYSQTIDSTLQLYSDSYQQEKVHIHFDKTIYTKGDTIWYKAYVLAGTELSNYSKNFYADWYDAGGRLLKHCVYPMAASSASGRFDIPAEYTDGALHLRAYTKWMLNFDSSFLYNKEIPVFQPEAASRVTTATETKLTLFPEGGDLINGLETKLAFKATDLSGMPVNVHGTVKNSKGEVINTFTSQHDGMGSFTITPKAGEYYTAAWTDQYGRAYSTLLPVSKVTGAGLQVQSTGSEMRFIIKRTENAGENLKMVSLVAHINQQVMYHSVIKLSSKTSVSAVIPTGNLPSGVMQVTLFDNNWLPLAERIVFINNHEYLFNPVVTNTVSGLGKREKNIIEIDVPDSSVFSNLSIAVTDGELPAGSDSSDNNIISQLLMCGDIKGYVHDPGYYFSSDADSVKQQLDLVMLTNGWRRFNWENVVKGKMPVLINQPENDYIRFKGKISGVPVTEINPDQKVVVIVQAKDTSSSKHSQTFLLDVDAGGNFSQSGFLFYDTLKVSYKFPGNRRLEKRAKVAFFNGLLPQPSILTKDKLWPDVWPADTTGLMRSRYFAAEKTRLGNLSTTGMLREVTVNSKAKTALQIMDEKYTFGLFSGDRGSGSYSFDALTDPRVLSSPNVFQYLRNTVPGLEIETDAQTGDYVVMWRQSPTDFFLDETRVTADVLGGLSMNNIAYVKVFRPIFFGSSPSMQTGAGLKSGSAGGGGAIAVYLKKGDEKNAIGDEPGMHYSFLEGYTAYKQFYSPDYAMPETSSLADTRETLYWNPYIITNPLNHKVKLEFYNNDVSKKLRIILEGVNANGKMTRVEKMIE